jgi:protein-tyrosine phosphatase
MHRPIRVLFVCLGNICRSPLAEVVMRHHVAVRRLSHRVTLDSAGTGAYHVGEAPDARMQAAAKAHGVETIERLRARQFTGADFTAFDLILAMDQQNLANILRLDARGQFRDRVQLLRDYDPTPGSGEVPDPYYEGGFSTVYEIVERSTRGLLEDLVTRHGLEG